MTNPEYIPFTGELDATPEYEPFTGKLDGEEKDGAFIRGLKRAKQSATITTKLATGDTAGTAETIRDAEIYNQQNPSSKESDELSKAWEDGDGITGGIAGVGREFAKDWRESKGFVSGLRETGKNVNALREGIVSQLGNSVAPMVGLVAGGAAGAAAGTAVPVVGNIAGGIAGGWAGAAAGNTLVEGGGQLQDALHKANIDPMDTVAVEKFVAENGDKILGQSAIKGGIIGAVDTATAGIAGRLLNVPARAAVNRALVDMGVDVADKIAVKEAMKNSAAEISSRLASDTAYQASRTGAENIARNAGAAALDPAGEFTGEYVGQGAATGDWNTKNAALEALSSVGQSGAMFAGQKGYQALTNPFRNGKTGEAAPQSNTPITDAAQATGAFPQLPAPSITVNADGTAETAEDRNARIAARAAGDIADVTPIPNTPEYQDVRGFAPAARQTQALEAPTIIVDGNGQALTAQDRNNRLSDRLSGGVTDVTPIQRAPEVIPPSRAMGLNPANGSLSGAAAMAVDSGASVFGSISQQGALNGQQTQEAQQAGEGQSQGGRASGAAPKTRAVKTLSGEIVIVNESDLTSGAKSLRTFTSDGKPRAARLDAAAIAPPPPKVVLQNRDRSTSASIQQMNNIVAKPDFLKAGTSSTMDRGAPMVFGDLPSKLIVGRTQQVADDSGKRIPTNYAVVEADDLLASNNADGTTNNEYAEGVPGKLRAVAGNGRVAGLQEAWNRGTTGGYAADLAQEAESLGIDPQALAGFSRPVLVRVMDEADVTADIGDRSNIQSNLQLSVLERAGNDVRRMDLRDMEFNDKGNPTSDTMRQFMAAMPTQERGDMLDKQGLPTLQLIDRIKAAAFKQAYMSDSLVELATQSVNDDAKRILNALTMAAGDMVQLDGTGEFDIRQAVADAAGLAVNAAKKGEKLSDYLRTVQIDESPEAIAVARFFEQNSGSANQIADGLRAWANLAKSQVEAARANADQGSMFGETPTLSRNQLFERLSDENITDIEREQLIAQQERAKSIEQSADAESAERAGDADSAPDSEGSSEEIETESFALDQQTPQELQALEEEQAALQQELEQEQRDAEAADRAKQTRDEVTRRSEAAADSFQLGQSAEDSLSGQGDIFAQQQEATPEAPPKTLKEGLERVRAKKAAEKEEAQAALVQQQVTDEAAKDNDAWMNNPQALADPVLRTEAARFAISHGLDEYSNWMTARAKAHNAKVKADTAREDELGEFLNGQQEHFRKVGKREPKTNAPEAVKSAYKEWLSLRAGGLAGGRAEAIESGNVHTWAAYRKRAKTLGIPTSSHDTEQVLNDELASMRARAAFQATKDSGKLEMVTVGDKPAKNDATRLGSGATGVADNALSGKDAGAPYQYFEEKTGLIRDVPSMSNRDGTLNEDGKRLAYTEWSAMSEDERALIHEAIAARKTRSQQADDSVRKEYLRAEKVRLEGERIILSSNGNPYKTEGAAAKFIEEKGIEESHYAGKVDGGWAAVRRTPSEMLDRENGKKGIEDYTTIQSRVVSEMGLTQAWGEDAITDAQWEKIDNRVDAIQRGQRGLPPVEQATDEAANTTAQDEQRTDKQADSGFEYRTQGAVDAEASLENKGERVQTYVKGDKAEYTGETEVVAGQTFYQVKMLEGVDEGKTKVVASPPDGDKTATVKKTTSPPVTPQIATPPQLKSMIGIAADSIEKLRKQDVERVLSEAPAPFLQSLAAHIRDKRKDLVDEVAEVMQEVNAKTAPTPTETAPKPEAAPAPTAKKTAAKKPDADKTRAKADLMNALADLGDILGKGNKLFIVPEQEQKLLPVLARVLDAAFRLGYHKFKDASKFALDQMRKHLGNEAADALTIDHLQGAYIAMSGGKKGVDTKRAVIDVETKAEIESHEAVAVDEQEAADNDNKEAKSDERNEIQSTGTQALEPVATRAGEVVEGSGRAGIDATDRSGKRTESGAGVDGAGLQVARSGGSGTERVHPPETRDGGGLRKPRRVAKSADKAAAEQAIGTDTRPEVAGEPASAPNVPAADFQITDETRLGQGGEVAKFNDNLAAIRTLKAIEEANRRATPEEQAALARYVGWGGLANAFPDPLTGEYKSAWSARGKELRELLDDAEFAAARRSTRNAHYTSKPVVQAMWKAVERLGFKGGLALETSMGVGNFLGLKPQGTPASFIGVEYDSLTSRIAQALYPQATVLHSGFQDVPLADNAFALSIGNPPFGSESLRFQYKPELAGVSIHNQFFRASMDALRPGGIQAMVVSRFLMDAKDKSTRLELAKRAKLIAAIRLPDTAFKENARTEVVTDIIILQKLDAGEQAAMSVAVEEYKKLKAGKKGADAQAAAMVPVWVETADMADPLGGEPMTVNAYFEKNKANILGVMERSGSMQHGADITVRLDDPASMESLLAQAVERLPQNIQNFGADVLDAIEKRHKSMSDALRIALSGQEVGHVQLNRGGVIERVVERETPEGGIEMGMQSITAASPWSDQLMQDADGHWYYNDVVKDAEGKPVKVVRDGKTTRNNLTERIIFKNEADVPEKFRLGKTGMERLQAAVVLRDSLKRQIVLETADAAKGVMDANRKELAKRYDAFVEKFGPVNRSSNLSYLMTMPDGGLIAALEVSYQAEITAERAKKSGLKATPEKAVRAPILSERVVPKYEPATKADSASDALAITLSERGRVDVERIAQLRGLSADEALSELQAGSKPLVFLDPETQQWETADAYLSGNVRRKLNAAKVARADANVSALEAVQPEAWGAEAVTVMLGSTWVPPKVYADFAEHLSGGKAKVQFSPVSNTFTLTVNGSTSAARDWSSEGASVDYILGRLMNSQPVVVTVKNEDGRSVRHEEFTKLAQLKAKEISAEFLDWVFKDGERRTALVDLFNEKFNTRVVRQRDGSHLKLPGKVPDSVISMRRHQKNVIWRGITDNALLMDHAVGAGKTFAAIARAMERRRMGLSKKPMIVVPNHLVDQWESDIYRLYPGAKVLAAGKKDFEKQRRRRLFGKIATGDWDIVVVPHSSFGFIGIDAATEQRFLQMEMDQAVKAVKDAEDQAREDGIDNGRRKPFGVKEAERLVEKIQTRMDKLNSGNKDRLLTFEQMGVDDLTVDEAHEFKNLYYSSRMTGVRGMGDKTGSRKANDLYNKVRALQENPASSVAFLTGTPISNSAVEMYTVMRYLAPQQLKDMGLEHFDAWRAQFVEASAAFEPTESGSLKEVTRLGRSWSNMRSLMDLYYEFTDAVSLEDIQRWYSEDNGGKPFPVPKVKGGERKLVNVKPTAAQEAELRETIAGFDGLKDIQDPYERNAARLRLMDRARKLSLDVRAVDPRSSSDEAGGKLDRASQEIKRIYDQWSADRGAQMVFLDRSVPKAKGDDKVIKEYDALVAKRDEALAKDDTEGFQNAQDALDKFDANEISELRNAQAGGWNAYQQIKDNLIAMGVPANEIRFIQEANNDEQKQALFDAVNSGQVRVLIGSSQRMGAGTNAQKRLVGLHHIDVTWKPSDIEQREGRIIRQGNELLAQYGDGFEVEILAYATERTVDAKMWDLNATKLKTINGIRKYDGAFSMDFEDEDSVSMAEMAALASGNPLLLERVKTDSEINMLELQERAFRRRMYGAQDALQSAQRAISQNPKLIERAKAQEAVASRSLQDAKARKEARKVEIEGKEYDSLISAYAAAKEAIEVQQAGKANARYSVAVDGKRVSSKEAIDAAIGEALGDASLFEAEIGGRMVIQRTAAARELAARLNTLTKGIVQKDSRTETVGSMMGFDLVLDSSAYSGYEGDTLVDSALSLVSKEGETVTSLPLSTVMVNQSYVTSNLTNATTQLFNSVERLAEGYGSKQLQRQLDRAKSELPELQSKVGQSFPKAEDLAAKRGRLRELVSLLDGANHDIRFGRSNIGQQGAQNGQENGMPRGLSATSTAQSRTLEDKINADLRTKPKGATTSTIRHAASRAYGKLLERLEAKGLVHVAQTEEDALQAAAKARAAKTGQSVAQELNGLRRSMGADEGDNIDAKLSQDGAIEGFFDRQTGKSFLVADNLTEASAPGTLMHEVGIHMAAGGKLEPLFKRAGSLLKTGTQNEFIQRVKARMARAGETSDEEAAAYIVTEYENDRAKAPITIGKWLADLTAAVRAWLFGKGVILKAEQLTVADIAAVARANARSMARGGPNGGPTGGQAFSRNIGDAMPHPFTGFTREKFLGEPKITPDSNAKDLIPSGGKSIDDKPAVPFSNKWYPNLVARYSENGAAVYDGEKVIASYYFGDTIVVDKKYRRAGIGSELVYQWRMRNPNSKTAATRTKKSQALQEKVWDRVQRELYQQEYGQAFSRTALPATLNIDGKDRPTTNSNGQPIHPTEEGVRNFYRWFGDSRVVDDQGRPLVVYHATNGDFNAFSESKRSDGFGYYFGLTEANAKKAATGKGRIIAAYIKADKIAGSVKAPAADWLEMRFDGVGRRLAGDGFDAAYIKDEARGALVVRNPTQIKSATGNSGAFDSKNPDIRFSRASPTTGAAIKEMLDAQAAWDKMKKGDAENITLEKFSEMTDRSFNARTALADELVSMPDDGFALQAKTSDGRMLILTPSAQKAGKWQLTRFGSDGAPWGDTNFDTKKQAALEFIDEADLKTIQGADNEGAAFSRTATGNNGNFDPENDDITYFGQKSKAKQSGSKVGTPTDRAVMDMVRDGKTAQDVLRLIAGTSRSKFNKQVARLLLKTGAAPSVHIVGDLGSKGGFKHLAKYSRKNHALSMTEAATGRAEQIFLHEMIHAATLMALDRKSLPSVQMRVLFNHVKKQGGAAGQYGMTNVGEFVSEAFTNPKLQQALRGMKAPAQSPLHSAWDYLVRTIKSILGLPHDSTDALSAALEIGVAVMRENMALRKKGVRGSGSDANAGIDQTQTPEFKRWFGDSKVVDADGKPLVVYHGSRFGGFSVFVRSAGGFIYTTPNADYASRFSGASDGSAVYPVYVSIKKPLDLTHLGERSMSAEEARVELKRLGVNLDEVQHWEGAPAESVKLYGDGPIWRLIREDRFSIAAKNAGFDGIKINEGDGETAWVAFESNQIKSAIGNNGNFDPENDDITYFGAAGVWQAPEATKFDQYTYLLQDKQIDSKRVVNAIKENGKQIADDLDVYLQETLFHGRAAKRVKDFAEQEELPLIELLRDKGLELSELEEYLHARHAPEANWEMSERNPNKAMIEERLKKAVENIAAVEVSLRRAPTDKNIRKEMLDAEAELSKWRNAKPYKGEESDRLALSGMSNEEAAAVMDSLDATKRKNLQAAAKMVDRIIAKTRETIVDYGLESDDTVDAWSRSWNHYVPLMREQLDDVVMGGMGTGQGFSIKGKETKGRTGSTKKVVDILANINMQRERAIVRGEKNRVATALLGLVKDNPNKDFWRIAESGEIPSTQTIDKKTGLVITQIDPLFKSRDNALVVKVNGVEKVILFNEDNPRAMRMAVALKNMDAANLEGLLGNVASVTRYLAAVNTQYNPIFGVVNMVRDFQDAAINMQKTPLAGKQKQVLGNAPKAIWQIGMELRAQRKGEKTGSEYGSLWEEFQEQGGQTGYRDMFNNSAERSKQLQNLLKPDAWADTKAGRFFTVNGALKVPLEILRKTALRPMLDLLSDYNEAIENGVRLSAYKAALDIGMSKPRAAELAKNLTVNFNRKGQVAQQVGALYAFFNASVQGTARMGQTLFNMEPGQPKTMRLSPLGKKIVGGAVLLGSVQALLLAAAGFGEDEPPEFIRERNLVIPNPLADKGYTTIPMPLGYHVLANLGRIPTEYALGGSKDGAKRAVSIVDVLADIYNPLGGGGLSMQTISPTVLDPFAALAENKDFTGRPIAKESFNKTTPGHALGRDTSSFLANGLAQAINYATGGTEYTRGELSPTPDQIDYLLGQALGGVGREASKVSQTAQALATGDDLPWHKVPLIGRFYGSADTPAAVQSAYYATMDDVRRHAAEVKGLRNDGRGQDAIAYMQKHPQAAMHIAANRAETTVKKLRDRISELKEQDAPREQVKALEMQMTEVMQQFSAAIANKKKSVAA